MACPRGRRVRRIGVSRYSLSQALLSSRVFISSTAIAFTCIPLNPSACYMKACIYHVISENIATQH